MSELETHNVLVAWTENGGNEVWADVYLKEDADQRIKELQAELKILRTNFDAVIKQTHALEVENAELVKKDECLDYLLKYKHEFWLDDNDDWRFICNFQCKTFVAKEQLDCVHQAIAAMKSS